MAEGTFRHDTIVKRLGAGGMGVVHRAEDTRLERQVALKLLGDGMLADPTAQERLCRWGIGRSEVIDMPSNADSREQRTGA